MSKTPASVIRASLILSRAPIVTKDIPVFEKTFYNYNKELEQRLMWTFPKWYYFKKGTVAEREFREAQNYPVPASKGVWFPNGIPDIKHGRDRRFKQSVILPTKKQIGSQVKKTNQDGETEIVEEEIEAEEEDPDDVSRSVKLNSRITKADESNDMKSLERKLPRTLYLIINNSKSSKWELPTFDVVNNGNAKGLHEIAEDGVRELGGDKINTWTVSNSPAAIVKTDTSNDFLIKSHIIAGKFDPKSDSNIDYLWVTKEEMNDLLNTEYYSQIQHLFHE